MEKKQEILKIQNLSISFKTENAVVNAVRGINLNVYKGETVAIVGESGSGKSVSVKTIMGISSSNEIINSGTVEFTYKNDDGQMVTENLLNLSQKEMRRKIKGRRIAMVFQDPMTSLDPTMTIGKQLMEGMRHHFHLSFEEAFKKGVELLNMVGIKDAEKHMKSYPHQLSGGMRQRVVIAIALSCNPDLLICDEPTTALDVTIQALILQLLIDIQKKIGISVIFITHNLGVVAKVADYVNVMYAGRIVETGKAEDIFYDPRHPYTWGLLSSMPDIKGEKEERLYTIPGNPPNLVNKITGDAFAIRNKYALNIDFEEEPPMFKVNEHHYAATWLLHPDAPKVELPEQLRKKIEEMRKRVNYHVAD